MTNNKTDFITYLDNRNLSKITKRVYKKALNDDDFNSILYNLFECKDIFEISDKTTFNKIYSKLKSDDDFKKLNSQTPSKGKYNFSSALNYYGEYLSNIDYNKNNIDSINTIGNNKYKTELETINIHFSLKSYNQVLEECKQLISKIEDSNSIKVYLLLLQGESYYNKGESFYENALESYENALKISQNNIYLGRIYINLGDLFFKKDENYKAIEYYDKCISISENNEYKSLAKSKKGAIYYNLKEYDNALALFKESLELTNNFEIKFSNSIVQTNYEEIILENNIDMIRCYNKLNDLQQINNIIISNKDNILNLGNLNLFYMIRQFIIKIQKEFNNENCDNLKEFLHSLNRKIAENKLSFTGNADNNIIELATTIENILSLYTFEFKENEKLIHYTKQNVVKLLFNSKNKVDAKLSAKLRLSNTLYLNDPKEGELFKDMLLHVNNSNNSDIKTILTEIFKDELKDNRRKIIPKDNNIYLTSFSKAIDELPMWISYSNNATGVGLVLDNEFFSTSEKNQFNISKLSYNDKECEIEPLIEIKYIDKNNLISEINSDSNKELREYLIKLNQNLQNIFNTKNYDLNLIKILLDNIRFIFKDIQYSYEKEVRVISIKDSNTAMYDETIEKSYIELNLDLNKCNEIILGSKCENKNELATYLYKNSKNQNLEITISSAEYR